MAKISYDESNARDRRIVILRVLLRQAGYRANSSVLNKACREAYHDVSRAVTRGDIAWLEEQGLVACEDFDHFVGVTLTERGQDVAGGQAEHPGVDRPSAD